MVVFSHIMSFLSPVFPVFSCGFPVFLAVFLFFLWFPCFFFWFLVCFLVCFSSCLGFGEMGRWVIAPATGFRWWAMESGQSETIETGLGVSAVRCGAVIMYNLAGQVVAAVQMSRFVSLLDGEMNDAVVPVNNLGLGG